MRLIDYLNACKIYELHKKATEDKNDLETTIKLTMEILYYGKKNKSKF